jgi:uncharacterized protein
MLPDLQHLIHLQELDSAIDRAKRRIVEIPTLQQALESRAAAHAAAVQTAKDRITTTSATRREIEKDVSAVQSRLSKYKDQLMAVKTNKEYQAMQTEIATAEAQIRTYEDRLLDLMEIAERESADLKSAEEAMRTEQAAIAAEQKKLEAEKATQQADLERFTAERAGVAAQVSPQALGTFERVAQARRGIAVAEAKDGLCSECHVRLRPQVFNDVRRNAAIIQCDSCGRILHYVPPVAAPTATS